MPKKPTELDKDSEEEDREKIDTWTNDLMQIMINEFNDVNDGEKIFMQLWNLFLTKNECLADFQLISIVEKFIREHYKNIKKLNIYNNFLLHLANLCDYNLLTTNDLIKLVDLISNLNK